MKERAGILVAVAGFFVLAVYGTHVLDVRMRQQAQNQALERIDRWSPEPRIIARQVMEKYGPPQAVLADRLVWNAHRPWKRIAVYDASGAPLEQVVDYDGPVYKLEKPLLFPYGSRVDAFNGELSARGSSEEINRLALNLADDVIHGRRTPQDAYRFYLRTVDLAVAGKSSPYLDHLRFEVNIEEPVGRMMSHF